jgi:hypothetical protein
MHHVRTDGLATFGVDHFVSLPGAEIVHVDPLHEAEPSTIDVPNQVTDFN